MRSQIQQVASESFSSSVNAAFGSKLRRLRRSLEISQGELASRVGLSRVTVATIEAGKQNTQLNHIFLFARALDTPLEFLMPSLREVEQQKSSSDRFLQEARALLLQMKESSYEHQAADKKAD